jgi:phosphoenolpyruvate---glycerone phosphotransferase subunit DhaL
MSIRAHQSPQVPDPAQAITAADVVAFVRRAAAAIRRHEALLDRLDAALGDGDHGTNMRTGLEAAVADLEAMPPANDEPVGVLVRRIGHVLLASVGGASGPLYATAFIEAGFVLESMGSPDFRAFAAAMGAGACGLARRGRCAVGDKTILDALRPATDALLAAAAEGSPPGPAFEQAVRAARRGVQATIPLVARRGLALRLGERSRGHRDPGALSCFLLIRAMLDGRATRPTAPVVEPGQPRRP